MTKKMKKAFTLVELVIVIAVIAILAAVLIPTFTSLINKANTSADVQAVSSMNSALALGSVQNEPETIEDVKTILTEEGFNADYVCTYANNFIVWDKINNQLILAEENVSAGNFPIVWANSNKNDAYIAGTDNWERLTEEEVEVKNLSDLNNTLFHPTYILDSDNATNDAYISGSDMLIDHICDIKIEDGGTLILNTFKIQTEQIGEINLISGSLDVQENVNFDVENITVNHLSGFTISSYGVSLNVAQECYNLSGVLNILSNGSSSVLTLEGVSNFIIKENSVLNVDAIEKTNGSTAVVTMENGVETNTYDVPEIGSDLSSELSMVLTEVSAITISTADDLQEFLYDTSTVNTLKAVLINNISYDPYDYTEGYSYTSDDAYSYSSYKMLVNNDKDLNLNSNSITIYNDTVAYYCGIYLNTGSTFSIYNGTFIAGLVDDDNLNGVKNAIWSPYSRTNVTLYVSNMIFVQAYTGNQAIKFSGGYYTTDNKKAYINDSVFYVTYGGGIISDGGDVELNNCEIYQIGMSSTKEWNATALAQSFGGFLTVNSGTYEGKYGAYVFSSGGTINISGGDWQAYEAVLKADNSSAGSTINVSGGTFDGKISIASGATLNVTGGTFSNTGLTLEAFSAFVSSGYTATEISMGVYTVTQD